MNSEIGREALRLGKEFESIFAKAAEKLAELALGKIVIRQSPEDDHAKKTDIALICELGDETTETRIQLSLKPKSPRQRKKLKDRKVIPMAKSSMPSSEDEWPKYIANEMCENCPLAEKCGKIAVKLFQST